MSEAQIHGGEFLASILYSVTVYPPLFTLAELNGLRVSAWLKLVEARIYLESISPGNWTWNLKATNGHKLQCGLSVALRERWRWHPERAEGLWSILVCPHLLPQSPPCLDLPYQWTLPPLVVPSFTFRQDSIFKNEKYDQKSNNLSLSHIKEIIMLGRRLCSH